MSRLRPKRFTPAQEAAMEESERLMARAQIYRAGVREALSIGYPGPYDLDIAIQVLTEVRNLESRAFSQRRDLDINPGKAKRANPRRPRSGGVE